MPLGIAHIVLVAIEGQNGVPWRVCSRAGVRAGGRESGRGGGWESGRVGGRVGGRAGGRAGAGAGWGNAGSLGPALCGSPSLGRSTVPPKETSFHGHRTAEWIEQGGPIHVESWQISRPTVLSVRPHVARSGCPTIGKIWVDAWDSGSLRSCFPTVGRASAISCQNTACCSPFAQAKAGRHTPSETHARAH